MSYLEIFVSERTILTVLVWGLILEMLAVSYYVSLGLVHTFEFIYTLTLLVITLSFIIIILRSIRRKLLVNVNS